jgi:release factor glutamine methyltransferase
LAEAGVGVSIGDALTRATARLAEAGCDTARLDAELLLAEVLGVDRGRLLIDAGEPVEARARERFEALVARREAREPVAYILGRKGFRYVTLEVDRRVLVPRAETELLVEVGISLPTGARVVDVGTGSGAVALALKDERPDLTVVGVDVSADALDVARANAARLGLDVDFLLGDLLQGIDGPFDAVLANLPYVAEGVGLPPEIAHYEPPTALFGGPDGLDAIRRLVAMAEGVRLIALEVGLAEAVSTLLKRTGFRAIEVLRDLAGRERVVVGRSA